MKNRRVLSLIFILLGCVSLIFSNDAVSTDYLSFTVPESLEIQSTFYKDLKENFIKTDTTNLIESFILQPKGINDFNQEVLSNTYCRIIIEVATTEEFIDNADFAVEFLKASESEKQNLSKIFENAARKEVNVRKFYDVTSQEVGSLHSWRYGYDRASTASTNRGDVHVDKYLIRDKNLTINITASYRISEKQQWVPIIEDFLRNNLSLKSNRFTTQNLSDSMKLYPLYSSKETFLWDSEPNWVYENLGIPEIPNARLYSTAIDTFELFLLKGYTINVSVIVGLENLLLFPASKRSYLSQSKSELLTSLESNTMLPDLRILANQDDYKNNTVTISYIYANPLEPGSIMGEFLVKITQDRKVAVASAEWISSGEYQVKRIMHSIGNRFGDI